MSPIRKFTSRDEALKARQSLFPYRQLTLFDIDTTDQCRLIEIDGERHWARITHEEPSKLQIDNCRQERFERLMRLCEENDLDVMWHTEYGEPGYETPEFGILTGDWNDKTRYNRKTKKTETIDDAPSRIAKLFEKFGRVDLEWEDEWYACECGKLVRTSPDCMSWTPSYQIVNDCVIVCAACLQDDPAELLEELEGTTAGLEIALDLEEHGWAQIAKLENYAFTDRDLSAMAKALDAINVERYVFCKANYTVWVPEEYRGQIRACQAAIEDREMDINDYLGDLTDALTNGQQELACA